MTELLLDPSIRTWVFLPIALLTFLIGLLRHYAFLLFQSDKKGNLQAIIDTGHLVRSRCLRDNGGLLTPLSYQMRKISLLDCDNGFLVQCENREVQPSGLDTTATTDALKGNLFNMMPMLAIGGWINCIFSGFVATRVPFPLTVKFKSMLQRDIQLFSLDTNWVSSASWYFLCVFGMRSIYMLVLGVENGADCSAGMDKMAASSALSNPKAVAKAEWEALSIHNYQSTLIF